MPPRNDSRRTTGSDALEPTLRSYHCSMCDLDYRSLCTDPNRCHRRIVARLLAKCGAEDMGERQRSDRKRQGGG